MRYLATALALIAIAGCHKAMSPELVKQYQGRTLYTCCNLHYETPEINDANYHVGATIPPGSPVQAQEAGRNSLTVLANGVKITLVQAYGNQQESFQQYIDKIFVAENPNAKLASYPKSVQSAISESRVEVGMNKEQVLMSLGYPPTHRTASTASNDWTYWYNRWVTFRVVFNDSGRVTSIIGSPAPTNNQPIVADLPAPEPAKAAPAKKKKH